MEPERITAEAVLRRMDAGEEVVFVDARSPEAWEASDSQIPHSIRLLGSEIQSHLDEIPPDKLIVTYCT